MCMVKTENCLLLNAPIHVVLPAISQTADKHKIFTKDSLKNKCSCGFDNIPVSLINRAKSKLITILTHLIKRNSQCKTFSIT